jgi:vacuolar-type H+-ATPase subunit C/Vma6
VSDFDYLNARVRGMSTALLGRGFYDRVLAGFGEAALREQLMASPYQAQLQAAITASPAAPLAFAVEAALCEKTRLSFAGLLAIAPARPRRLLALQLNRWDLAAVIAVLRAWLAGAAPENALRAVLAIGELAPERFAELAGAPDVPGIADWLTADGLAFTFVLRRAILDCGAPRDPRALERAVCAAFFRWALGELDERDAAQAVVYECIRWQVDLLNVIGILAFVRAREGGGAPLEGGALEIGARESSAEPVAPGTIPAAFLADLAACDSLESAFEALTETWFSPGIERGILAYGQSRSLAVMERFLEAVLVERACRLFRRDMLGIGVGLGYIWRTYAELCNLRMLARGVSYRMTANAVREGLVIV